MALPLLESKLMWWAVLRLADPKYDHETAELRRCRTWYDARPVAENLMRKALARPPATEEEEVPF